MNESFRDRKNAFSYTLNMVKNYYRKTNKVVARSKREAQPEVVTEHSQPEAMTEHPQPPV
jgi:hypothetical protein